MVFDYFRERLKIDGLDDVRVDSQLVSSFDISVFTRGCHDDEGHLLPYGAGTRACLKTSIPSTFGSRRSSRTRIGMLRIGGQSMLFDVLQRFLTVSACHDRVGDTVLLQCLKRQVQVHGDYLRPAESGVPT